MKHAIRKGRVIHLTGEDSKGATTNTFQSTKWNQTQGSKEGAMIMSHL